MSKNRFNWQIWAGSILSIFAFISYPTIFVEWPLTRDFPWANIGLFLLAIPLIVAGVRRAFSVSIGWLTKVGSALLALLGTGALVLFVFLFFVFGTWLPESANAPQIGRVAPEFSLLDQSGQLVSLVELRTRPIDSTSGPIVPRGVLLIFYRGYW